MSAWVQVYGQLTLQAAMQSSGEGTHGCTQLLTPLTLLAHIMQPFGRFGNLELGTWNYRACGTA
jgi:hypothetical protein